MIKKQKLRWLNSGTAPFLSKEIQSHDVFDFMLNELKRADKVVISSFAITEAYIRRLIKNSKRIGHVTLFLDVTIGTRNPRLTAYASMNVNELYLLNNHSKTIYMYSQEKELLAVMSNNATNNHRFESGIVFSEPEIIKQFVQQYELMKAESCEYDQHG
jgi:hypothetical protein